MESGFSWKAYNRYYQNRDIPDRAGVVLERKHDYIERRDVRRGDRLRLIEGIVTGRRGWV